jgi:hypothetical protein
MSMVKADEAKASPPPKALFDAINELVQEASKEGCVMVQAGGLLPTSSGMRVRLAGGKLTVTDGPFTEAKELIGGFAIMEVPTKEEALELGKRFMQVHADVLGPEYEGELEIRPLAVFG